MHWREAQESWFLSLEAERRSSDTIKGYKGHFVFFNRFLEMAGITQVEEITPFHLRRFLAEYANGRSPATLKTVYGSIRTWLRWLVSEEIIKGTPTERVKAPKAHQSTKDVYSPGQLKAIFKFLEKTKTNLGLRNYALVSVLADTGARASEVLSITVDDIQDGTILLRHTKSGRLRTLPLGTQTEKALWRYIVHARPKMRPKGTHVYLSADGMSMTRNALQGVLDRIGEGLGFPVSSHRFRHTWATTMLRRGVDFETLRRLGGWSDYTMLQTYSHLSIEDLKKTQRLNSLVDNL